MVSIDDFYSEFYQYYKNNLKESREEGQSPIIELFRASLKKWIFGFFFLSALAMMLISFYGLTPNSYEVSPYHLVLFVASTILAIIAWKFLKPDLQLGGKKNNHRCEQQFILALEKLLKEKELYSIEGIEHITVRAQRKIDYIKDNQAGQLFGWVGSILLAVIISISANIIYNDMIRLEDNVPYSYLILIIAAILSCLTLIRTLFKWIEVLFENKAYNLEYMIEVLSFVKIKVKNHTNST
jgi:hypothetical protein